MGAQARQDRGVQPAAARRDRHELRRAGRRSVDPARRALLHHARQRHAAAARRRARADRHHHASAESRRSSTPAARPRRRGLRHPAAAHQRDVHERGRLAVRAALLRPHRRRSRTRPRCPTPIRISSAKASSPARASTTSTRSRRRCDDSVPENALLSHDLFEGLHARVALVSDVELVDEYPSSVLTHARRQHRWIRGDWQILFWLFPVRAVSPRAGSATRCRSSAGGRSSTTCGAAWSRRRCSRSRVAGWTVLPGPRWFWTTIVISGARLAAAAARGAAADRPAAIAIGPGVLPATCGATPRPRWRRSSSASPSWRFTRSTRCTRSP